MLIPLAIVALPVIFCVLVVVMPICPVAMRGRERLVHCVGMETRKDAGENNVCTGMDYISDRKDGIPERRCANCGKV